MPTEGAGWECARADESAKLTPAPPLPHPFSEAHTSKAVRANQVLDLFWFARDEDTHLPRLLTKISNQRSLLFHFSHETVREQPQNLLCLQRSQVCSLGSARSSSPFTPTHPQLPPGRGTVSQAGGTLLWCPHSSSRVPGQHLW